MAEGDSSIDNPKLPGPLNEKQLTLLKSEISALTPKDAEIVRQEATQAQKTLKTLYGQFISPHIEDKEFSNRFLFTDRGTLHNFKRHWTSEYFEEEGINPVTDINLNATQTYQNEGGNFVIGQVHKVWNNFTEEQQQDFAQQYGGVEKAKEFINGLSRYSTISHELSHLYQDADLPDSFRECGAYFLSASTCYTR